MPAGFRQQFRDLPDLRLVDDPRHDRAEPDVPGGLWRHGQPGADERCGLRRLYGRHLRQQRGTEISLGWAWWLDIPIAIIIAMVFGTISGALAVRTEGIYTIMITLAIASAFFYFTRQNYVIFNGFSGFNSLNRPSCSVSTGASRSRSTISPCSGRRSPIWRCCYVRARPSGWRSRASATIPGAWRRSASTSPPTASRLYLCRILCRHRRHSAVLAQRPDLARHRRHRAGDRHSDHRRCRRPARPIGPFIGALVYVLLRTFCARRPGSLRPRRPALPAAHRPWFPAHRFLLTRRLLGLWERWKRICAETESASTMHDGDA